MPRPSSTGVSRATPKGDIEGALQDYSEAIRLKPDDAESFFNRGDVCYARGDLEGALQDYGVAVRLKPEFAGAFTNRCDRLFQTALASLPEPDRGPLLTEYAVFLRYRIDNAVCSGDLVLGSALLARLETIARASSPGTARLRAVLNQRLGVPSHEKAYALIDRDPDAARATWQQRLQLHPGEHDSLEHLACLAWTRAFDAVQRADRATSLAEEKKEGDEPEQLEDGAAKDYAIRHRFLRRRTGLFPSVIRSRKLLGGLAQQRPAVGNVGPSFQRSGVRRVEELGPAGTSTDPSRFRRSRSQSRTKNGAARAKSALTNLRHCDLPKEMVEVLMVRFAECFLDRDPTAIPPGQFGAAMAPS